MARPSSQFQWYSGQAVARRAMENRESALRPLAIPTGSSGDIQPSGYDVVMLRLFLVWIFLQCFFYGALPFLHWDVGIGIKLTPDKLVLVMMLLVMGAHSLRSPSATHTPPVNKALSRLLMVFTTVCLLSWWVTGSDAGKQNFGELTRVLNISAFPALAYVMARHIQYSKAMLRQLAWFFAVLGLYLSITAFAEHYGTKALLIPGYIADPKLGIHFGRSRGPFLNTIGNGGMLLIGFLAWTFITASLSGPKRVVALCFTLLTVPAIYFTETRSVWLGLAAIIMTLLMFRTPMKRIAMAMIWVLALAFALGIGSKFSMFDQTLFSRRQRTVDYRLDNYQIAWNAFRMHPVFGLGYGKFRAEWARYADLRNSRLGVGLDDGNHNTMLGVLAELGLVGAIPFVGMTVCGGLIVVRACRRLKSPRAAFERQVALMAIGAFQTFVVLGITSDLKAIPTVNILAFWFVGLISSVESMALQPASQIDRRSVPEPGSHRI